jgi:hypothetical protein
MPVIQGINVVDGLKINHNSKKGPLTLEDFKGNREIYNSYLTMIQVAKNMDKNLKSQKISDDIQVKNNTDKK